MGTAKQFPFSLLSALFQDDSGTGGQINANARLAIQFFRNVIHVDNTTVAAVAVVITAHAHTILAMLGPGDPIAIVRAAGVKIKEEVSASLLKAHHIVRIIHQQLGIMTAYHPVLLR